MRPQLFGIGLGVIVSLIGVVTGLVPIVILGVVLAFVVVALASMAATKANLSDDSYDDLSPESRILVRPLKKIYNEMAEAASGSSESISPYLAKEALMESRQLLNQSIAALLLRDKLIKDSRGRYDAEKGIADLESRLANSTSDDERQSLQSAMDARRLELTHYDTAKQGISKIESSVKQAEAAMAEMKAKLVTSGSANALAQGEDPLREAVGRMHALSASLTEAQEMIQS